MRSIKDFTDIELDKQIEDVRIDLDQSEYGTGDYNHAEAELAVAEREKQRRGGEQRMAELKILSEQFSKIIIETDEENPVTIAVITEDLADVSNGYRVRMTPKYN